MGNKYCIYKMITGERERVVGANVWLGSAGSDLELFASILRLSVDESW